MNAVRVLARGWVVEDPQLIARGPHGYLRLGLLAAPPADRARAARSLQLSAVAWFVAFDARASALVRKVHRGDHLEVQARIRAQIPSEATALSWQPQLLVIHRFRLRPGALRARRHIRQEETHQ